MEYSGDRPSRPLEREDAVQLAAAPMTNGSCIVSSDSRSSSFSSLASLSEEPPSQARLFARVKDPSGKSSLVQQSAVFLKDLERDILDERLHDRRIPEDERKRMNLCVRNVRRSLDESKSNFHPEKEITSSVLIQESSTDTAPPLKSVIKETSTLKNGLRNPRRVTFKVEPVVTPNPSPSSGNNENLDLGNPSTSSTPPTVPTINVDEYKELRLEKLNLDKHIEDFLGSRSDLNSMEGDTIYCKSRSHLSVASCPRLQVRRNSAPSKFWKM